MNGSPSNDNSVGIQDAGPETDEITFTAAQVNSLINAVTAGADQPVTVVLNMGVSGQVLNVAGGDVRSHGELVLFGTVGSEIVGYVNVGGGAGFQAGTDREVSASPSTTTARSPSTFVTSSTIRTRRTCRWDLATPL